jgi:hypothetical protein
VAPLTAASNILPELKAWALACPLGGKNRYVGVSPQKQEKLVYFYDTLGTLVIGRGYYNAKNTYWEFRLITPKGRKLLKTMESNNLKYLSTRKTYIMAI